LQRRSPGALASLGPTSPATYRLGTHRRASYWLHHCPPIAFRPGDPLIGSNVKKSGRAGCDAYHQMKRRPLPTNLVRETWNNLDSDELRKLLHERFGYTLGQYASDEDPRLYLPEAGPQSRIALTYKGSKIAAIEPGQAFDAAEWKQVSQEIEHSILDGTPKTGRDYSFSSFPVQGSWRGRRSGVQILPASESAPRGGADHPFILEFPIKDSDLPFITNHRRIREHRKITLLLNLLLEGRTSCLTQRHDHLWAIVFPDEVKWVREGYYAPLDHHVLNEQSSPAANRIEEVEPDEYYSTKVGNVGRGLQVPANLDESICHYLLSISPDDKKKFDRATFWLDTSRRQWTISASATFAAHVSAIEALTERGTAHQFKCPICGGQTKHEVPGATQRFKNFIETYAPGVGQASRKKIYDLRSDIVHGSELIELDNALAFGWDPLPLKQGNLLEDLSMITRVAMRNWLKSKSTESKRTSQ
jgi:hypothetical protein